MLTDSQQELFARNELFELNELRQQMELENTVASLKRYLDETYPPAPTQRHTTEEERKMTLIKKIEQLIMSMVKCFVERQSPKLTIRNVTSWQNVIFEETVQLKPVDQSLMSEVRLDDPRSTQKFAIITLLLSKIHKLLSTNDTCTKREIFYQNAELIPSQDRSDAYLNQISCLLESPLHELNIFSTSKGVIFGPLVLKKGSQVIDCSKPGGTMIPNEIVKLTRICSTATFIVVIEKDAVFQKFIENGIPPILAKGIFLTAKGFPDENTRALLKQLWETLRLPIFALVDGDPWGIEIMCVYRFGSLTMSHQSDRLAVPSVRWLGVLPSEIGTVIDKHEPFTDRDAAKLNDIMQRPYVKASRKLYLELQRLQAKKRKADIENMESSTNYITHVYVANKILCKHFV